MAGFWRKCRFAFRCARFTVWGLILLVLGAVVWLDVVGLPNFVKTRLVAALQQRGVQLEFTRMRWRPVHGLVCDNVHIGADQSGASAILKAKEVQIRINVLALLHAKLQVDGLVLHDGCLDVPLSADETLAFTNLQSELRFEAEDTWSLDQFRADLAGATVSFAGEVAHAPECRNWKIFSNAKSPDHGTVQASLRNFQDTLNRIHLDGQPQLSVRLNGDARDVHSFSLIVTIRAPGVQTPWFSVRDMQFGARVLVPTNTPTNCDPAWGFWTNLQPFRLDWTLRGTAPRFVGLQAETLECKGNWSAPELAITNLSATLGGGSLNAAAHLNIANRQLHFTTTSSFDLHAADSVLTEKTRQRLSQISWTEPPHVQATGTLTLPPWTAKPADWHDDFEPVVELSGELGFTNAVIAGIAPLDSVHTHFIYSNLVWTLPDLQLIQGRTLLNLSGREDDATKNFRCALAGNLDANSIGRFLTDTNAERGFDILSFRDPVSLTLGAAGNLTNFDVLSVTGRVAASNFAIRGQWVDSLTVGLTYSNLLAEFLHPNLSRANGTEKFVAEKLLLDITGEKLFLYGGLGHVSPTALAQAIGPKTAEGMAPYQFLSIPEAHAEGCIPLKQKNGDLVNDDADLRVDIIGTAPFRWRQFETPAIGGTIYWHSNYLIITNVVSECYHGSARGWGSFNVQTPGDGTDLSFFIDGTNVDFNAMGRALWSPTNDLRGSLSGKVTVTYANSADWHTWNGYGNLHLQNGLLWNAPVLGLMSPVLNTITPGLDMGNSRATDAAGRFMMTNGVIYTDSLQIQSMTMRLQYVGTVDLDENISARVKAQLFRNTPWVGSMVATILSPVSKVFECRVGGTLGNPRITPMYIPFSRVLAAPLHPIRSVQELFTPNSTNAAPQ